MSHPYTRFAMGHHLGRTSQHRFGRTTSRQKRQELKAELLAVNPVCFVCGCQLIPSPFRPNSAHIVRKRLSRPQHIEEVRKIDRAEKERVRSERIAQAREAGVR